MVFVCACVCMKCVETETVADERYVHMSSSLNFGIAYLSLVCLHNTADSPYREQTVLTSSAPPVQYSLSTRGQISDLYKE